jgi:hypothetical protein
LPVALAVSGAPVGIVTLKNRTLRPVEIFIDCADEAAKPLNEKKMVGSLSACVISDAGHHEIGAAYI